jgi:hypothetical protein
MGNKVEAGYPSDVTDEEWAFVLSYLRLSWGRSISTRQQPAVPPTDSDRKTTGKVRFARDPPRTAIRSPSPWPRPPLGSDVSLTTHS